MTRLLAIMLAVLALCGCSVKPSAPEHHLGAGPQTVPISFLVRPDGSDQLIVCSSDGGCAYGPNTAIGGAIIWRPGGTAGGDVYTTCATVEAALTPGSDLYLDCTNSQPVVGTGCNLDLQGYGSVNAYYADCGVTISGTGSIKNVPYWNGVAPVELEATTGGGGIVMTQVTTLSDSIFELTAGATVSPIQVAPGGIIAIALVGQSGFVALGGNPTPFISLGAGASVSIYANQQSPTQTPLLATMVGGDAGTTLNFYGDPTGMPMPAQTKLAAGATRNVIGTSRMTGAGGLWYDASANVVGGAPTCIGPPPYCFGDASPEPTGVGEVLQIVKAGPLVKFAPINGRNANSFTACDGGEVLVGGDGGIGNGYCVNQSSIAAVTSVTGSAPITCSPTTGAVSCSISAATTGALGTVELANDLDGTGASPVVLGARGGGGGSTGAGLTFGSNGQITCGLTATDCQITQQAGSGLSAVGNTYLIESQQETGSGSTGGDLELYSASGVATNGILHLGVQGTDAVQITTNPSAPEVDVTSGSNLFIGNLSSTHLANGTNMIAFRPGAAPSSNLHSSAELYGDATNGLDLMDQSALTLNIKGAGITQTTAAQSFTLSTTTGTGAASTSGASGSISVTTGNSAVATSGTATGAASGLIALTVGNGAPGLGGTSNGGAGGAFNVFGGTGGAAVSTGTGGVGSSLGFYAGNGGAPAGAGTGGAGGTVLLESGYSSAGGGSAGAMGVVEAVSNNIAGAAQFIAQLDYTLSGTANSQALKVVRKVCPARIERGDHDVHDPAGQQRERHVQGYPVHGPHDHGRRHRVGDRFDDH